MFLTIRESIAEVLHESFGNQLGRALGREVKLEWAQSVKSVRDEGCQIDPQIVVSSSPDLRNGRES